jgi:histidinol-phosphate aminotransferase
VKPRATAASIEVIREEVRAMHAYVVAASDGMVKLDQMENPYGLPQSIRREIADAIVHAELNRYPDPTAPALHARLRQTMRIPQSCDVMLGNGSDEIIHLIIEATATPGAAIMTLSPTFVMYSVYAKLCGVRWIGVPLETDFSLDVDRFLQAVAEHRPAVVFLAYPNNPTGNLLPVDAVERILAEAPGLVVLDEAYHVFARKTFLDRLSEFPNMLVLRSFSKLGLAGIRLGYVVGRPEWIRELDKVRSPYNVNTLTQIVAEKMLAHLDVFEQQAAAIRAERERLAERLRKLPGVQPFPSDANFLLVRVPDAKRAADVLKERRILMRSFPGHPVLNDFLRPTIGTPEENEQFLDGLRAALARTSALS